MVGVVVKPSVELCRCMQEKRVDRGERERECLWLSRIVGSQEWLLRRLFLGCCLLLHRLR